MVGNKHKCFNGPQKRIFLIFERTMGDPLGDFGMAPGVRNGSYVKVGSPPHGCVSSCSFKFGVTRVSIQRLGSTWLIYWLDCLTIYIFIDM